MTVKAPENPPSCGSQNRKGEIAESRLVARIAQIVRKAGLTYDDWRYVARRVRQKCDLHPAKKPKKLPRILTADQFRAFYKVVDRRRGRAAHPHAAAAVLHGGAGLRNCARIEVADVDLENCKIFVNQGKGSKDRYVLFGKSFATALRTHIAAHPQPLAVPDQAMRQVLHQAGAAGGQAVCGEAGVTPRPILFAIMPRPGLCRLAAHGRRGCRWISHFVDCSTRHNYRSSRKANNLSSGRYRRTLTLRGVVVARASSFNCRSA